MSVPGTIAERIEIPQHPTVVKLDDLLSDEAEWISQSYFLTGDVKNHLQALKVALKKANGIGIFLIGHYGSGKSHFLAYLIQQIHSRQFSDINQHTVHLSLVNFSAEHTLESIIFNQLGLVKTQDRREAFKIMQQQHPQGLLLILDELSEFLRSREGPAEFNEDIRFLQFLGEWAQSHSFWILAAMQEQIEHTGDLDHSLYRKIKDRFPLRFLLTPVHVRDLVSQTLLIKKPGYDEAVSQLVSGFSQSLPRENINQQSFSQLYPLHPVTLEFLEEVRDSFSQARGIVDFVVTQLRGHEERQIKPFLQRSWGELLTPDFIIDHFRDLFEIQPEFLPLSNQCLTWYRQHLDELFPRPRQHKLARQLIKLLMLIYISPVRRGMRPVDAVYWLMFRASQLDVNKNIELLQAVLDRLVDKGRFIERNKGYYQLNLKQDSQSELAHHIQRAQNELQGKTDLVFEQLSGLLVGMSFNPFEVSLNEWQPRSYRWHFHERSYWVCLGESAQITPAQIKQDSSINLLVRLPWSPGTAYHEFAVLQPESMPLTPQWMELAAMLQVLEHPLSNPAKELLSRQIKERTQLFYNEFKQAYLKAKLIFDRVKIDQQLMPDTTRPFIQLIEQVIQRLLRKRYPSFERFAPSYGPLPKHSWVEFLEYGLHDNLLSMESSDAVRLVQEAYLIPMGLIKRKGREYQLAKPLERHELVSNVFTLLEHEPSPSVIYTHLAEPVYGLVMDQVHCLLYFLLIQGEINILKDSSSLKDNFKTLLDPRQYDRVQVAYSLSESETAALTRLLTYLEIKVPEQWSVSTQRNALDHLLNLAQKNRQQMQRLSSDLPVGEDDLKQQINHIMTQLSTLYKSNDVFQGWQHFLLEIESVQQFIDELDALNKLPAQLNRFLTESGRFIHIRSLFQQHTELEISFPNISQPPGLKDVEQFERWLIKTTDDYHQYCKEYTEKHEHWWAQQEFSALLSKPLPDICRSRHLGLSRDVARFEVLCKKIKSAVCQRLSTLEYQPFCQCGFDGRQAPVMEDVRELTECRSHIEQQLDFFFRQDKVRQRVQQWSEQGIEANPETQAYLAGSNDRPKILQLEVFDNFLSGVEMTHAIDAGEFVQIFAGQSWQPDKLAFALQQWAGKYNQYASIRIETDSAQQSASNETILLHWIVQQSLQYAIPLPERLNRQQHKIIQQLLRPEWVSPILWRKLDSIGLDGDCINKLLGWLMDGTLDNVPEGLLSSSVVISQQLGKAVLADDFQSLAKLVEQYYSMHQRFIKLDRSAWLKQLEQLAQHAIQPRPRTLVEFLNENPPEQWLVLDAMGLPLLNVMLDNLTDWFPAWKIEQVDFVLASGKTTTDEFYRSLLGSKFKSRLVKINTIDEQIHQRFLAFDDLCRVIKTELGIAIKNNTGKLQPQLPLLISGDHGFRISVNGKSYQHGGSSTLERIIPLIFLRPA